MRHFKILLLSAMAVALTVACSDDDDAPNTPAGNLVITSGISATTLGKSAGNAAPDQITVDRIRILMRSMKIRLNGDERTVHPGPLVFEVTPGSPSIELARTDVPAGALDKISYDIQRFEENELASYAGHALFGDFATSDRLSILISGKMTTGGNEEPFSYSSVVVGNINFDFSPALTIDANTATVLELQFQPEKVFMENGVLLDPASESFKNQVDNKIKDAFLVIVK